MQENIIISPRRGGVIVGTWNKKLSFIGLTLSGWAISDELYRGDNKILSGWQQNPVGVTQYWNSIGVCWAIGIQFGVVLEGFRGLNDFFIRLGVTTEFCRGDKNDPNVFGVHPDPSGCNPEQPRATPSNPDRGSDEGCYIYWRYSFMELSHVVPNQAPSQLQYNTVGQGFQYFYA